MVRGNLSDPTVKDVGPGHQTGQDCPWTAPPSGGQGRILLKMSDSYLVTRDEKRSPDEEPRDNLGSGRHEEERLLRPEHKGDGSPGGVGPLRGHGARDAWRKAIGRVASQPLRQALGSPPKLTHLFGDSGASSVIMLHAIQISPNLSGSSKRLINPKSNNVM